MRALTLTQPWAGLVAAGIKLVENRSRSMIKREDFGKLFAIHASKEIDEDVYLRIAEIDKGLGTGPHLADERWWQLSRITSAVIAVAGIDRVVTSATTSGLGCPMSLTFDQRRWFFGPVGYVLRDVIALPEPVPCRGWQGFWTLDADTEAKVREQLRPAPTRVPGAGVQRHG